MFIVLNNKVAAAKHVESGVCVNLEKSETVMLMGEDLKSGAVKVKRKKGAKFSYAILAGIGVTGGY